MWTLPVACVRRRAGETSLRVSFVCGAILCCVVFMKRCKEYQTVARRTSYKCLGDDDSGSFRARENS